MMKKLTVALSVLAILGLAAPAMAQNDGGDTALVDVNVHIEPYATIEMDANVIENTIDNATENHEGDWVPFTVHASADYELWAQTATEDYMEVNGYLFGVATGPDDHEMGYFLNLGDPADGWIAGFPASGYGGGLPIKTTTANGGESFEPVQGTFGSKEYWIRVTGQALDNEEGEATPEGEYTAEAEIVVALQ